MHIIKITLCFYAVFLLVRMKVKYGVTENSGQCEDFLKLSVVVWTLQPEFSPHGLSVCAVLLLSG